MKEIGGYFELELHEKQPLCIPQSKFVNSGRHALEYILRTLKDKIKQLWIPYYTCDVVLEPIKRIGIDYNFYHINDKFELYDDIILEDGDYLVINNYFGIKDDYINKIIQKYGSKIIVDNAQAFYHRPQIESNAIYSPRKFFGIPDGGIAVCSTVLPDSLPKGFSFDRCSHLLKRIDAGPENGYADFKTNSATLKNEPMTGMSSLTLRILTSIDFEWCKNKRRSNFENLHSALSPYNKLSIPDINSFACPMVYPFMTDDYSLRQKLIDNKIFIATYWLNVLNWCQANSLEYRLTKNIIPLPIDQRYDDKDMSLIYSLIKRYQ